jgi:hypothetical protein
MGREMLRWALRLGIAFALIVPAGCTKGKKAGVSYSVSVITKGRDGKVTPQGSATQVQAAKAEGSQEISYDGQNISVAVRKTQYGKATFEITFPNKAVARTQVKVGTPRDILPRGQKVGVRIELQESH